MSFIDIKQHRTRAAVIFLDIAGKVESSSPQQRLEEAIGLALAINLDVIYSGIIKVRNIKPSTLVGVGNLKELLTNIENNKIDLVIFDTSLTPIQQRNLEKELNTKVIDRTALILEIFGERAQTKEGKLQVELAHLTYQRSRLVRSWTHLERQRGGAGFLGGPGETQIELDRRIIDKKILKIKQELDKVKQTRGLQRYNRKKTPCPVIAFVGYTNAGKSTLFNLLTNSDVVAKDMLFATLDPTMHKVKLPSGKEVILSDTVGFVSNLPHELIMSFRATLEEVISADIIVHVRDISASNTQEQRKDVIKVLTDLGLNDIENSPNYIEVLNKADLLDDIIKFNIKSKLKNNMLMLSALTGEGSLDFLSLIEDKLSCDYKVIEFILSSSNGKLISWIYQNSQVLSVVTNDENIQFKIRISKKDLNKLLPQITAKNL